MGAPTTATTMESTRIAQTFAGWCGWVPLILIDWTEMAMDGGASRMGISKPNRRTTIRKIGSIPLCEVSVFWWVVIAVVALGYCSNTESGGGSDYYDPGPDICWDSPGGAYFC